MVNKNHSLPNHVQYIPIVIGSGGAISINPDKTLNVNGRKTFPVYMSNICNAHFEYNTGVEPCNPTKNSEFLFSGDGESIAGMDLDILAYEATNVMYTLSGGQINSIPQKYIDSPNFFGYIQSVNEPADSQESAVSDTYNKVKARDPNHPLLMDHWVNMPKWIKYSDIITMWIYPYRTTTEWAREDSLYAYEHLAATAFFTDQSTGKFTEINTVSKPVWGGIQAYGISNEGNFVLFPKEVRALTYTTLTMDVKGIGFWGYLNYGGSLTSTPKFPYGTPGLYNDPQLHSYYRQLGRELVSFNDILVLPTQDYSWHFRKGTQVSFNPNPTKHVLWNDRPSFNYLLKQDGNTWYLFVVNKNINPIANVNISLQELTGSMTVKTLGLETSGSGRAGRVLAANNGQFTDSFDGYAVHIYEISQCPPSECNFTITQ